MNNDLIQPAAAVAVGLLRHNGAPSQRDIAHAFELAYRGLELALVEIKKSDPPQTSSAATLKI